MTISCFLCSSHRKWMPSASRNSEHEITTTLYTQPFQYRCLKFGILSRHSKTQWRTFYCLAQYLHSKSVSTYYCSEKLTSSHLWGSTFGRRTSSINAALVRFQMMWLMVELSLNHIKMEVILVKNRLISLIFQAIQIVPKSTQKSQKVPNVTMRHFWTISIHC